MHDNKGLGHNVASFVVEWRHNACCIYLGRGRGCTEAFAGEGMVSI